MREGRGGWAQTELPPCVGSCFPPKRQSGWGAIHTAQCLGKYTARYLVPAPKSLQAYLGASSGHLGLCASSRSPVPASHCSSHHAPAASCMARPCPIPTLPCLQVQVSSTQHPTTCSSVTITTTHHPSPLLSLPIFQPPRSSSPHSVPPRYILFLTPFLNIGIAYFQRTSICLPVDHLGWTGPDWTGNALDKPTAGNKPWPRVPEQIQTAPLGWWPPSNISLNPSLLSTLFPSQPRPSTELTCITQLFL